MARSAEVQVPGEESGDTEHSTEAALDAGASGRAHRVRKHRLPPPAPTVDDPARPAGVGINAKAEISYDEAMERLASGELTKAVLTPDGWVCPPEKPRPEHRGSRPIARG